MLRGCQSLLGRQEAGKAHQPGGQRLDRAPLGYQRLGCIGTGIDLASEHRRTRLERVGKRR